MDQAISNWDLVQGWQWNILEISCRFVYYSILIKLFIPYCEQVIFLVSRIYIDIGRSVIRWINGISTMCGTCDLRIFQHMCEIMENISILIDK